MLSGAEVPRHGGRMREGMRTSPWTLSKVQSVTRRARISQLLCVHRQAHGCVCIPLVCFPPADSSFLL